MNQESPDLSVGVSTLLPHKSPLPSALCPQMKKLIYKPERNPNPRNSPLRIARPLIRSKKAKNADPDLEFAGTWLLPGANEISDEEWNYITSLEETQDRLNRGEFELVEPELKPEGETYTGSLSEYSLLAARKIIVNTHDIEKLEEIVLSETRPEIVREIRNRIKEIDRKLKGSSRTANPTYGDNS
jgi:hypothetical protein